MEVFLSDVLPENERDLASFKESIKHDIDRQFECVLIEITRTCHSLLPLQGAADVVFTVDDDITPVDFDALKEWFSDGFFGPQDRSLTGSGDAASDLSNIETLHRVEHLMIRGNRLQFVPEDLLNRFAETLIE